MMHYEAYYCLFVSKGTACSSYIKEKFSEFCILICWSGSLNVASSLCTKLEMMVLWSLTHIFDNFNFAGLSSIPDLVLQFETSSRNVSESIR